MYRNPSALLYLYLHCALLIKKKMEPKATIASRGKKIFRGQIATVYISVGQ